MPLFVSQTRNLHFFLLCITTYKPVWMCIWKYKLELDDQDIIINLQNTVEHMHLVTKTYPHWSNTDTH